MAIADALRNEAGRCDSFGLRAETARGRTAHSCGAAHGTISAEAHDPRGETGDPYEVAGRTVASARTQSAICALLLAGPVALGGFALPTRAVFAQEKVAVATRASGTDAATDQARLAELGIGAGGIEQCEDATLLWRAVRELVLPQRVSEPMQQRILRRVWIIDPDIANGSRDDSETQ